MNPGLAFVVVRAVWTGSDVGAKKTKSMLSSLFVASIIFLVGFLTGIYIPIGQLPEGVQTVIKVFPPSHSALLLRQVIMEDAIKTGFAGAPASVVSDFKEMLGVTFQVGGKAVEPLTSILILIVSGFFFLGLSMLSLSRKKR